MRTEEEEERVQTPSSESLSTHAEPPPHALPRRPDARPARTPHASRNETYPARRAVKMLRVDASALQCQTSQAMRRSSPIAGRGNDTADIWEQRLSERSPALPRPRTRGRQAR